MKLIIAVLVVRAVISLFENNRKAREKNDNRNIVIHPAEFQVR